MKKILFSLMLLCCISYSSILAQSTSVVPDNRLYECYDSCCVHQMLTNNPLLVAWYNYYLDNSYYVASLKASKPVTGEDIHTVRINDDLAKGKAIYFKEKIYNKEKLNVLKYYFPTQGENFTTYVWKEAGVALVFLPRNKIADGYQKYIKDNNLKK